MHGVKEFHFSIVSVYCDFGRAVSNTKRLPAVTHGCLVYNILYEPYPSLLLTGHFFQHSLEVGGTLFRYFNRYLFTEALVIWQDLCAIWFPFVRKEVRSLIESFVRLGVTASDFLVEGESTGCSDGLRREDQRQFSE
jgi:hypothetical protein